MNTKIKTTLLACILILISLSHAKSQNEDLLNCFGVIAGKNATTDGSVLLAHNEDDSGEQMLNIYNVPQNAANNTNKYLWIEFPGMAVADAFLNEYGVAVVSDGCNSREDRKDYTDGGVLYEVRTTIAQNAKSARHAVELAAKLVEEKGYRDSGRTYLIADCNEAWVFAVVRGRHWVAQRVPDDAVMTIPNYYCITEVDLADTANFKGSPDIISYAQERGWYNPATDGKFSFRKAYSRPDMLTFDRNYIRHISAMNYLTGETFSTNPDDYPFAVKANRKVDINDLIQILTSHGDNVEQKVVQKTKTTHPVCICTDVTINATVFQLRNWLPIEIGAMMWTTGASPCAEVFIPWYSGMSKSPAGFTRFATAEEAIQKHFSDAKEKRKNYPDAIAWKFIDRWHWILEDYPNRIGAIQEKNSQLQQELFKRQNNFEKQLLKKYFNKKNLTVKDAQGLQDALNEYTESCYREYFKTYDY